MNSLSLLIYIIGVVEGMGIAFRFMAGIGTVGLIISVIWWFAIIAEKGGYNEEAMEGQRPNLKKLRLVVVPLFIFGWLGCIFFPSQRTVILMASSEIGEKLVNSDTMKNLANDTAKDIIKPSVELLNVWIKKETDSLKKEMKKKKKDDEE